MTNHTANLHARLWDIANTLRGKMGADEFRDYILGFISIGVSIWFRESHFRSKTLFLSQKEPKPLKKVEKDVIFSKRRAQHFQRILPIKKAPF